MKIYIASSWRNQHGVEMLTELLRQKGHEVISWIENNYGELGAIRHLTFDEWMKTENANKSFAFDINGATECDLLIYYSPAGQDACAELGAAWAVGATIYGLAAKGEGIGLMSKMVHAWHYDYRSLLCSVEELSDSKY